MGSSFTTYPRVMKVLMGEGSDAVEDGFDKWIRKFRERAKFAGWSAADQLYQLELHLDKTALDMFHMLPDLKTLRMLSLHWGYISSQVTLRSFVGSSFTTYPRVMKVLSSWASGFNNSAKKHFLTSQERTLTDC